MERKRMGRKWGERDRNEMGGKGRKWDERKGGGVGGKERGALFPMGLILGIQGLLELFPTSRTRWRPNL